MAGFWGLLNSLFFAQSNLSGVLSRVRMGCFLALSLLKESFGTDNSRQSENDDDVARDADEHDLFYSHIP